MKNSVLILLSIFMGWWLNGQNLITQKSYMPPMPKSQADSTFAMDSMIYYTYNTDWEPVYKIINTVFDVRARIKEQVRYNYNSTNTQWEKAYKNLFTYDINITSSYPFENVDTYTTIPWNSNTLSWANDTIGYFNLTPYYITNHLGTNPVYEEKFVFCIWDFSTNQITGGSRTEITLIQDSLYDNLIDKIWNSTTQSWQLDGKTTYSYDANNYPQEITLYQWDNTNSQWVNDRKYFLVFDNNGNEIQYVKQLWNGTSWINTYKKTSTYDNNNNLLTLTKYTWSSNSWVGQYKYEYTYDQNNLRLTKKRSIWDNTNSQWVNDYKYTYSYDSQGNMTTSVRANWDNTNSQWVNSTKIEYSYNSNNDLLVKTISYWDNTNSVWVSSSKYQYTYNSNGDLTEYLYQTYDNTNSVWVNNSRDTYEYDSYNNNIRLTHQTWDNTNSVWKNSYKYEYFYSKKATPVITFNKSNILIFPNPSHNFIKISNPEYSIREITITDINGKTVYSNKNVDSRQLLINLREKGTGLFIIKLTDEKHHTITHKVIVY